MAFLPSGPLAYRDQIFDPERGWYTTARIMASALFRFELSDMALTTEQFREQLIASGLLPPDDVASILSSLPSDKLPKDGEQLARELVRQKKLTKYQAEQIYSGKGKTLVLGNYVVLDKLGQGGMGVVLKAEHKRLKRLVALKVMSANIVKTPDALKRFHREVEAAAKLRHNNVVATDDADEAKGTHFLVMEYVEGSDLSVLVKKKGPLSVSQAVQCIVQAARGLEFAHSQGVVHRDIKPANLLLDSKGTVKILDMGLARIEGDTGSQGELTSTGAVMGTVDYMAPEQALSTKHADARSDIYSLGISLWYLLTGKCAYDGDTLMSKLLAHRDAPIPSLCRADPDIPASVDSVFRKMVAKQSNDRYQSMTEVIRDLEGCQSGSSPRISGAAPSSHGDPSLQSFLSNLGASSSNVPTQLVTAPAAGVKVNAASEATMINGDIGVNTDPETITSVRAEERQKKRSRRLEATQAIAPPLHRNPRVLLGGAAAAIVLLIAVIILIQTPHGTLRVEILDPEVEVTIKGTELTLSGTDIEPISLKTGEKNLVITRGDLSFETDSFTLRKGMETRVKVELLGDKLIVNGDGKVIAEQRIQRRGITASTTGKDSVASKSPTSNGAAPPPAIAPFDSAQARSHQEAWAMHLGVPVEYTNSIGMKFRLIPPGEFTMGSPAGEERRRDVEAQVSVTLTRRFEMSRTEVTQGQWRAVMGTEPWKGQSDVQEGDDFPATHVSWGDAVSFCEKLSAKEGKGYRLPTEAEWEWACRAGSRTDYSFGGSGGDLGRFAWFNLNAWEIGEKYAHRVGQKLPNGFGLSDMHGNVFEWCGDWHDAKLVGGSNPLGASSGSHRVYRGGGWSGTAGDCRSALRFWLDPSGQGSNLGFRLALSPSDAVKAASGKGIPPVTSSDTNKAGWHGWPADAPKPAIAPFDAAQAKKHQEEWALHLDVPVEFINSIGMKFKLIPPGEFFMGVDAKQAEAIALNLTDQSSRNSFLATTIASSPRHSVRITRAFYMQTHEVKNGQYLKVMKKLPEENDPANPDSPVLSNVSLADATAFCNALSETEGKSAAYLMQDGNPTRILKAEGYRLPTEAEWEYACRAGTTTLWFPGENGDMVANGEWLKEFQTLHVGADAKPNPFGLVDLYAGSNEWCFDRFAPYGSDAVSDPFNDPSGADGVLRGGNHFSGGGTDVVVTNSFARQTGFSNKNTNRYTGFGRVVLPINVP